MQSGDDDPTRALDDFARRMRPDKPATEPPALSARQGSGPSTQPEARNATLRSGLTWNPHDLVDVQDLAEKLRDATQRHASTEPDWQPDPTALQLRRTAHPRLLNSWQPSAWTGALREVIGSCTEFINQAAGPVVETYPALQLLALWPPQRPGQAPLGRWPQQIRLFALAPDQIGAAVLADLPEDATLWLGAQDTDWALAAEILLHHEPALRPFQREGLRDFIAAEREAGFTRLNTGYHQALPGGAVLQR